MGASASKIKFKESLTALTIRDVAPSEVEFWDELWKIPSSPDEVFELLTPKNARLLRDTRFENLATLFTQATAQLCQIVETPYTIYFDQALNCVRVLTRIVPFLLERGDLSANDPNVELLCWGERDGDDYGTAADFGDDDETEMTTLSRSTRKNNLRRSARERALSLGSRSAMSPGGRSAMSPGGRSAMSPGSRSALSPGGRSAMSPGSRSASVASDDDSRTEASADGTADDDATEDDDGDGRDEPLALLVVHAAMHMLFLPQFTCEYYDAEGTSFDDMVDDSDSESDDETDGGETAAGEGAQQSQADREAQAEAGLGRPRRISRGIRLTPHPAGIVWAPGVGFTPDGRCTIGTGGDGEDSDAKSRRNRPSSSAAGGNGSKSEAAYTRKYDRNRIEVLRLLLASCSDPLFAPADEYNPLASRWMSVVVAADAPNACCLFYSLLNTVISYDPAGHTSFGGKFVPDTHVKLVELSVQVLCVLLDCGLSGDPIPYENRRGEPVVEFTEAFRLGFNVFRLLLARINSGRDLSALYRGFVKLLRNSFESQNSLLPTSQARLDCQQEVLILLWKTLDENPLFLDFILTRCDVCELVVPICYLMYTARRDVAQIGLIHICTFILLKLSGERSFGVSLNRPFQTKLPCDLPLFSGSHADLVSITLHKLMVNGSYRLVPLYSCFLTVVCNISPYWRSMSLVASVKLVNLFELFSSPKFLYSGEKAHRHLALILEVFNNVIQYQYNGNQHLVYAIVRKKDSFGRLASLTLPKAIYQCNKAFPASEDVEYDADVEERAAAMSVKDVDEAGRPVGSTAGGKTASGDDEGADVSAEPPPPSNSGRFVPTEAWLTDLRSSLPLETISRLLQHLVPVVDDMIQRKNGVVDEIEILDVFKDITMVGLLPVPHAIVIRKYQPNQYTSIWFTAFMWGVIYLRSQQPPIFDGDCIELFQVSPPEGEDD